MVIDTIQSLYAYDLYALTKWWVVFYFPIYVLKWLYIFFPVFILIGGINGIRYSSSKNKNRQE